VACELHSFIMDFNKISNAVKSFKFDAKGFKNLVDQVVNDPNYTLAAVGLALLLILVTVVLIKLLSGSSSRGNAVLLIGLSDAGKTVMLCKLLSDKVVKTMTSMKQNEELLTTTKKPVRLCDLPGYDRLRVKFWDDYKNQAKGIIFVVDSLLFLSNIRDVADFLYNVLADPAISKRRVPILVACNKQDEAKAKSAKVIQNQLEKEINTIRETRRSALGSTDAGSDNADAVVIGNPDRDFKYSDLKTPIEFVDCSSVGRDDDDSNLQGVWKWLNKV